MSFFGDTFGAVAGLITGNKSTASKGSLARDWVGGHMPQSPLAFNGSKADLEAMLSSYYDQCTEYVDRQGAFINDNEARQACQTAIQQAWAPVIAAKQAESYAEEQQTKAIALSGNNKMYLIAAIVIAVLICITIIL
jgi:hypothetical protein